MAYNAFMIPFQSHLFHVYHNLCIALCLGSSVLQIDPNSNTTHYVKSGNYLLPHPTITYSLYINYVIIYIYISLFQCSYSNLKKKYD